MCHTLMYKYNYNLQRHAHTSPWYFVIKALKCISPTAHGACIPTDVTRIEYNFFLKYVVKGKSCMVI